MSLVRILLIVLLAVVSVDLASSPVTGNQPPHVERKFSPFAQNDNFKIEIDLDTQHTIIDGDGDTLAGAVVKVTPKIPLSVAGTQKKIGSIIYSLVAVCGFNGVVVIRSQVFDPKGKEVADTVGADMIRLGAIDAPTAMIYHQLCKGNSGRDSNMLKWI